MEHARPPADLILEGGPASRADAWRKWQRQFKIFLKASGIHKETSDIQASLLVNLIGPEGYDIYSTFRFTKEDDRDDVNKIIAKYDEHFNTKPNTTMARFKFFTRNQEKGESVDDYVTALKLLSQYCEFGVLEDGLVKDRIVCGILNCSVRDRLLRTDDLTLEKAMKICQASEMSSEENMQIEVVKGGGGESASSSVAVDAVYGAGAARRGGGGGRGRARGGGAGAARPPRRDEAGSARAGGRCDDCGGSRCDGGQRCPARSAKCFLCDRRGHYKMMCPERTNKNVHELCEEDDSIFYVSTIDEGRKGQNNSSKWYESLYLANDGTKINFKLDTGSDLNVISMSTFVSLGFTSSDIKKKSIKAQSFCGNYIPIEGTCDISCMYKNKLYQITFVITTKNCQSVLGKYSCEDLDLVQRVLSLAISEYEDLFTGLGRLPGSYRIVLEQNASPTVCPVRKIPIGVRDKLFETLNSMVRMGVIRKVSHPTPWVNAIVLAAKKNGELRVCLDPRPLNRVIRRAHYPLPTLTEIATKLHGARFFSKLDARSGFWMIKIDEDSADLCTFGTPFGRYQFLRLPYGINSASEVFHAKVRQLLEDLEGVDSFVDDIICWGSTKEEHDTRLRRLLDRAREVGIKFNRDKCEFCVRKVTYLGHTFSEDGMQIDKQKLKAIEEMPTPNDRSSLERFLGMVNYLSKFIPNYAETVAPLRCLLKKEVAWCWDTTHDGVVRALKQALCSAPVLALYSSSAPVLLSVDASSHALGAVLLQGGRPVEFASLTLTPAQTRYAQIEKELLAIVFALERFHQYVFGRSDVTVETDHKPLEALFLKSLDSVPARLQRMMLRIQGYQFKAIYKPGKYMFVADALSRAALPETMHEKVTYELEEQSCFVIENVRFSNDRLQSIRQTTLDDEECQVIVDYILGGWPQNKCDADARVHSHWAHRESLEYIDGVLFKDNLVYIPRALRSDMIARVHEGHLGIDRCKRRARDVMFWCGMSRDVERAVRACRVCTEHAARPAREPMIAHTVPTIPWTKLGSDIFEHSRKKYLILVDYFSNYIEVNQLSSIGSRAVICAMKEQFARHGIPAELVTDNGPAYVSKEFENFTKEWGFKHTTSSPNYPQSNGLSERAVRTVKHMIKKSNSSGSDYYFGLLNLRSTPRDGIGSPSQLLMGRRLNTRLPVSEARLRPERDPSRDHTRITRDRERTKRYYDAHARSLPALQRGDDVIVVDGDKRRNMRVQAQAVQPRSYFLTDSSSGRCYRRNRRHLIKVEEIAAEQSPSSASTPTASSYERKETGEYQSAEDSDSSQEQFSDATLVEMHGETTHDLTYVPSETDESSVSVDTAGVVGRDVELDDTPPQSDLVNQPRVRRLAAERARIEIDRLYK